VRETALGETQTDPEFHPIPMGRVLDDISLFVAVHTTQRRMELVKEYIFAKKPRRPTVLVEIQPSTSSSSSSSSSSSDPFFDLSGTTISSSSSIMMPSRDGAGEDDNGDGQEELLLLTTTLDDEGDHDDGSSICSATDDNDSVVSFEMENHKDIMTTPPPKLLAAPFPLRHSNNKTTSTTTTTTTNTAHSSLSVPIAPTSPAPKRSSSALLEATTTSFLEQQQQQQQQDNTAAAAAPLFFKNGRNIPPILYNPRTSSHPNDQLHVRPEHDNGDDESDDILGRLMSHPITAQWMLRTASDAKIDTRHNGANAANANAIGWPMICVVGDTSSGKSSLLSNLSGIPLPTHHQLTTRCPILLHMARRRNRNKRSSPLDNNDNNSDNTSGPDSTTTSVITKTATIQIIWQTTPSSNNNNSSISKKQQAMASSSSWPERTLTDENWDNITTTILEAQEFILQQTQKQVAPDIVRVDVVYYHDTDIKNDRTNEPNINDDDDEDARLQHEYPYLTLLDLPGLIQTTAAAEESPTLVPDVQALVRSYLHSSHVLILAVLSCTTDFHNAQVLAEIFSSQNNNNNNNNNNDLIGRTIPVLTKPDLMDPGAAEMALRDDWLLGGKQLIPRGAAATTALNTCIQSSWSDNDNKNGGGSSSATTSGSINNNPLFTFHMVKGRGQAALDRGDSIEQGLQDEVKFFETREPWKSVANRTLFGTRHLQVKLARLQHDIVRKQTLPLLHVDIQERRRALQRELQYLMGGGSGGGCYPSNVNNNMEMMPMAVMLDTPADRRRYYQQVRQTLVASLQASLSGKKQHLHMATTPTLSRTTITRSTKSVYRKQLQQFNNCMGATSSTIVLDEVTPPAPPDPTGVSTSRVSFNDGKTTSLYPRSQPISKHGTGSPCHAET
jgi:Dynamin family/Dynamin central region